MDNANVVEEGQGGSTPAAAANNNPKPKKKLKKIANHTPMEILHGTLAILSVGTSVTGIILTFAESATRGITIFAGALTSVIGSYAYYQQTKLTDIIALKDTYDAIGREVGRLSAENLRLHNTMGDLKQSIENLEDMETALDVITYTQGQSVDTYAEHVQDSAEILIQMQKNLKAYVLQNLLQVVIHHDRDHDMLIEESEIDNLIGRIKMINGVDVVEEEFRELVVRAGGSLSAIMDILKNSMTDEDDEADKLRSSVFILKDSVQSILGSERNND
ncbi:hypothetical protein ACHAWT_000017 [Skeletonema menzelii]